MRHELHPARGARRQHSSCLRRDIDQSLRPGRCRIGLKLRVLEVMDAAHAEGCQLVGGGLGERADHGSLHPEAFI